MKRNANSVTIRNGDRQTAYSLADKWSICGDLTSMHGQRG